MPDNWSAFAQKNNSEALEIQRRDPDLVLLLSKQAPAALVLSAIEGTLDPVAPSLEDRQKEALDKEASQLFNEGAALNFSGQMRLLSLNPSAHERWKTQFATRQNEGVDAQNERQRQAQLNQLRLASRNL